MSYILDALKKSESEHQRQAGPALLEMRVPAPQRRWPLWALVVGALLVVNVLALVWFAVRSTPAAPAVASAVAAPAATTTAVVTATARPATPEPAPALATTAAAMDQRLAPADSDNPADHEPAVNSLPSTAPLAPEPPGLQNYVELNGKLPELRLDLHVYTANPAERYAFINMHKVREGELTPEGVRVLQITSEGVVLDYRGTEFLLGHQ